MKGKHFSIFVGLRKGQRLKFNAINEGDSGLLFIGNPNCDLNVWEFIISECIPELYVLNIMLSMSELQNVLRIYDALI